ncbi:MAG: hypothetical protein ASARMPREDX12_004138 [Alectoria sarmentosa]|nr:MAG: hypothetical protein ASARMPREDX12_004138 [Alectoria sarmentosa]
MGYCETLCQLWGVSFAIARLRRADEPVEAAWDYAGSGYINAYDELNGICGEDSGCRIHTDEDGREGEHLAGPGCVSESGYSGHRISLAEMKGCRAVQCLVKKDADWMPEDDDQDFEIEGDYFLTGVGDGSPDEAPLEDIAPSRHGISDIILYNMVFVLICISTPKQRANGRSPRRTIPSWVFHSIPHASRYIRKFARFALAESTSRACSIGVKCASSSQPDPCRTLTCHIFQLDCDFKTFFEEFPRESAVRTSSEQFWRHQPGCEYLAANPIDIPGLSQRLKPPIYDAGKKPTFGGNKEPDSNRTPPFTVQDPFSALSAEITSMVLDHLGSKDIANLRLATPVFQQLPTLLFRRLLLEDMPWLFEVKDLEMARIDWYEWYCTWKKGGGDLKGLRNRRRIWRDVEEIVSRITRFRKEGKIGDL